MYYYYFMLRVNDILFGVEHLQNKQIGHLQDQNQNTIHITCYYCHHL